MSGARGDEGRAARAGRVARMRTHRQADARAAERRPAPAPEERCDLCDATMPDDHRHLLHLDERRIVCARASLLGAALRRPRVPAGRHADAVARGLRAAPTSCGRRSRSRSGWRSSCAASVTGGVVAFYPSPAGATESELDLEAWDALVAAQPACSADLEPDAEALIVNRLGEPPQYAIAPIDQCYALVGLIKSRWEGISGGTALETAVPEFFDALRAARRPRRRDARDERPRRVRRVAAVARSPSSRSPAPRTGATPPRRRWSSRPPSPSPSEHEIQSIALSAQVMIDPARRGYDAETRERLAELFGPPGELGAVDPGPRRGRGSTRWSARSPGRPRSRSRCRAPTTSRSPRPSTSTRSRDGEVPLSFHFNGTVFYRGATGALQVVPVPWSSSAQFRMPVAAWRAMIAEHYPGGGWIRPARRHARRARTRGGRARAAELRRLRRASCWTGRDA